MIDPYPFILDYGITPNTGLFVGSSATVMRGKTGENGKLVEGIIDKPLHPGNSHTKDEAGAEMGSGVPSRLKRPRNICERG